MKINRFMGFVLALATLAGSNVLAAVTYYHNDLLGSAIAATDESRAIVWKESYRPYGERIVNDPASTSNSIYFTGRRQDPGSGLVYMGARYYEPAIGRFLSPDPLGFHETSTHSFNRYLYANNNPALFLDPDGQTPLSIFAMTVARQTGLGYAAGVGADAFSQFMAWGSVDLSLAATSNAAIAGGETGLLSGLFAGLARANAVAEGASRLAENAARGNAARAGANANRLNHIFGKAEHALDGFVKAQGGQQKAFQAIQSAANQALQEGKLVVGPNGILPRGNAGNIIDVAGTQIRLIGGRVVDGVVEISSASRMGLP